MKIIKKYSTLVFPGQGIQKVGMVRPYLQDKLHKNLLEKIDEKLNYPLAKLMSEGPAETLNLTEYAQPAIFICSYLNYLDWRKNNYNIPQIKFLIGHSVGEYTALTVANYLNPIDTSFILRYRGKLMQEACENRSCKMLVVMSSKEKISPIIAQLSDIFPNQICELAVENSLNMNVYSGDSDFLTEVSKQLKSIKINSLFLNVSAAFHCSILNSISQKFSNFLSEIPFENPQNSPKIIRNIDLQEYKDKLDIISGLTLQITQPVLFRTSILKAIHEETTHFYEFASKGNLSKIIKQILDEKKELHNSILIDSL